MHHIVEPRLSISLEDSEDFSSDWTTAALRELARQLGTANDFYFPLLGAARHIELEPQIVEIPGFDY